MHTCFYDIKKKYVNTCFCNWNRKCLLYCYVTWSYLLVKPVILYIWFYCLWKWKAYKYTYFVKVILPLNVLQIWKKLFYIIWHNDIDLKNQTSYLFVWLVFKYKWFAPDLDTLCYCICSISPFKSFYRIIFIQPISTHLTIKNKYMK